MNLTLDSCLIDRSEAENLWIDFFEDSNPVRKFLLAFLPFFDKSFHELEKTMTSVSFSLNLKNLQDIVFSDLSDLILPKILRTFVYELNSARQRGFLLGDKSEDRFNFFIDYFKKPQSLNELFKKYPLLEELIVTSVQQYINVMTEMFIRLNQDYPQIKSSLIGTDEQLELKKVIRGGDIHRQGRSVCILIFEGVNSKKAYKVVYKPRNLEIDLAYEKFLLWANHHLKIPLNLVKLIARENYGWFEFISSKNCQSIDQVHHYYQRLGYLMGIVYLLIGSDIHFENVIVSDENPYIVDLECLLVPIITSHEENELVIHSGAFPFCR